jgi:hypothetical protein
MFLIIDEFTGNSASDELVERHRVPVAVIGEEILDIPTFEETGRSVRLITLALDGDSRPFQRSVAFRRGPVGSPCAGAALTVDPSRLNNEFKILVEAEPGGSITSATFNPETPSGASGQDISSEFPLNVRIGRDSLDTLNIPALGADIIDFNEPCDFDTIPPQVKAANHYRLNTIEINGYVYRTDRIVGLSERVFRQAPSEQWSRGRPERAYSVLYRLNADGSAQIATFVYGLLSQTRKQTPAPGQDDEIDFVPIDFTVSSTEVTSGNITDGRPKSPISLVDVQLEFDRGRQQYYIVSNRPEDEAWLIARGNILMLNVHPDEDLDALGLRSRGADTPATIVSTRRVGNQVRGYLDTTPVSAGTSIIAIDDSVGGGGIQIDPGGSATESVQMLGFAVNTSQDANERFRSFGPLQNDSGGTLNGGDSSFWTLTPEAVRIFQVTQ